MAIHLRQVCLVAERLAPAVEELSAVLSIPPCHVDPEVAEFGLENTLLAAGSQFVEVVAPTRDGTAAGRFLERRGGDGGYMVICQVATLDEQAEVRARAAALGVRVAWEIDRGSWNIMQLHPRDMGGAFFEVDWDERADMTGNWHPAGGTAWREAKRSDLVEGIAAVELQGPDPLEMAERWGEVAGVAPERRGGAFIVPLANAELRFVETADGRGPGLGGIDLRVTDRGRLAAQAKARGAADVEGGILICGTRFAAAG